MRFGVLVGVLVRVKQGASSCAEVWVNGVWVGCSKDSFLDAEFDVTDALLPPDSGPDSGPGGGGGGGEEPGQLLAVKVPQWGDGSYLEDQVSYKKHLED